MDYEPFFRISYGLYIISSAAACKQNGFIANTVFQVTAEPPQLAISCNKNNYSATIIAESGFFSVSVLREEVDPRLFGMFGFRTGEDTDKFDGVEFITGAAGTPIVTKDAIAWFECELQQSVDLGSHILFIGKVLDQKLVDPDPSPLTYDYYRKVKKGKAPKNAPTYVKEE